MNFLFSQRERARAAAIEAAERYPRECMLPSGGVQEFWGFVINAALAALDEPSMAVTPDETREFAARLAPHLDAVPYTELQDALESFLLARRLP